MISASWMMTAYLKNYRDESDPQYTMSQEDLKILEQETDAKGRKIRVHKMPIPKKPVCITEKDLAGYVFEEGEDTREAGERLAASYVNFYIGNKFPVLTYIISEV